MKATIASRIGCYFLAGVNLVCVIFMPNADKFYLAFNMWVAAAVICGLLEILFDLLCVVLERKQ